MEGNATPSSREEASRPAFRLAPPTSITWSRSESEVPLPRAMEQRPLPGAQQPPTTSSDAPAAATASAGAPASAAVAGSGLSPGEPPPPKRSRTSDSSPLGQPARERASVPKVSYPKKRVNVACEVCRSRKTRCDAVRPSCSFCTEIGAQCIYRRPEEASRLVLVRVPWLQ